MDPQSQLPMHDNGNYSLGVPKTLSFLFIGLAVTCSMVLIGLKIGYVDVPKTPPVDVPRVPPSATMKTIEKVEWTPNSQLLDLMRSQLHQTDDKTPFNHFKLPLQIEPSPIILQKQNPIKDAKTVQIERK